MESTMRYVMALAAILPALAFAASATSAAETGKFCLKGPATTINCTYDTMASCDKAERLARRPALPTPPPRLARVRTGAPAAE